jgi:hypothetical protein
MANCASNGTDPASAIGNAKAASGVGFDFIGIRDADRFDFKIKRFIHRSFWVGGCRKACGYLR